MKTLFFAVTLMLSIGSLYAQKETARSKLFVRVFDLEGKKICKGIVLSVTDTTLEIKRDYGSLTIEVGAIGSIRTNRSSGHRILVGTVIGASTLGVLGAILAHPGIMGFTSGEGVLWGGAIGTSIGATIGAFASLVTKSSYFSISGDVKQWKAFKKMITG